MSEVLMFITVLPSAVLLSLLLLLVTLLGLHEIIMWLIERMNR